MITQQDKKDLLEMGLLLGLFIGALYMISVYLSFALNIRFESARHLVGSVVTVMFLLYVVRELITVYWRILFGVSSVILLVGFYGLSTEIYIENFTTLGLGELPAVFSWSYFFVTLCAACATAYQVKIDFFR